MKTIYKYPFKIVPYVQEIDIPMYESLLHVNEDPRGDGGALWFEVEIKDGEELVMRKAQLAVIGTGGEIPDNFNYLDSFIVDRQIGGFIWHIYLNVSID